MSPLIHKSMTWAIVGSVVLMSAWLASSVQDKHERGGFRIRRKVNSEGGATAVVPAAVDAAAAKNHAFGERNAAAEFPAGDMGRGALQGD